MNSLRSIVLSVFAIVTTGGIAASQPINAWVPRPSVLTPYAAPNRPLWKLSDILTHHAGIRDWTQTVADTPQFTAQYISMAPGGQTRPLFYADDRVFWVIQSGQVLFKIEGQEPFIASKGYLVQAPARVPFQLQTVGSEPSLRFEVRPAEAPIFPLSETPPSTPGIRYMQASFKGRGAYDAINKPFLNYRKDVVEEGNRPPKTFLSDPYFSVEVFRGPSQPLPPETDWGHFRANYPGLWFVLEGTQNFLIEGEKPFAALEGDVVFAPVGRFHRVSAGGDGMSTRLAINARPGNLHWYQPGAAGGE